MSDIHRDAFKEEAYENLSLLEIALLELEEDPDNSELVGAVFRYMHTIKGSGAMFGFDDIASFTHNVESVFDLVRSGKIAVTKELINLTLQARDQIRNMLDNSDTGEAMDRKEADEITASFKLMLPEPAHKETHRKTVAPVTQPVSASDLAYFIRFKPCQDLFLSGTNPVRLFKELATLGTVTITSQTADIPALEEINPEFCFTSWDILLVSSCDLDAVKDVFMFVEDDSELTIKIIDDYGDGKPQPNLGEILIDRGDITQEALDEFVTAKKKIGNELTEAGLVPANVIESALAEQHQLKQLRKERSSVEQQSSIRVPADRLDHLINLVGQQVTVQARLSQLAQTLKKAELSSIAEEVAGMCQ
jgi:two-component system chemotaxis sensor kinase CheA